MYEEFTAEQVPAYLSAQDGFFFKTDSIDSMAFIYDEDSNVGMFEEVGEQGEIPRTDTRQGGKYLIR